MTDSRVRSRQAQTLTCAGPAEQLCVRDGHIKRGRTLMSLSGPRRHRRSAAVASSLTRLSATASTIRRTLAMAILAYGTLSALAFGSDAPIDQRYALTIQPLLNQYCFECHADDTTEADVDLGEFPTAKAARQQTKVWVKIRGMLDSGQMPPKESPQPTNDERELLQTWVRSFLKREAEATAGDPGPVVLRRLNNEEYNYTVRDLTGVPSLNPTREFPVDGAAGEGFINTGAAQSMSPSFVTKYLNAAKEVAAHAVLTSDGITFSEFTTRRDWTDERVEAIRRFYNRYSVSKDVYVQVGGTGRIANRGGAIPWTQYLAATLEERDALRDRTKPIREVAHARGLSEKYLSTLWATLAAAPNQRSLLIDRFRSQWADSTPADVEKLVAAIEQLQSVLFRYNVIGHIGTDGQPIPWMVNADPIVPRRDFSVPLPEQGDDDVSVFLSTADAGDGNAQDFVVWQNPRLTIENGPEIPLRYLASLKRRLRESQKETLSATAEYLAAAAELQSTDSPATDEQFVDIATKYKVDVATLKVWATYLGVSSSDPVTVSGHFEKKTTNDTYNFVRFWGTSQTPIIGANSSDQQVRIPGISKPGKVFAHPSPTLFAAVGWLSPIDGVVTIEADISDAHPECGDGQEWFLQHRTNQRVGNLWKGSFGRAGTAKMKPQQVSVRKGELISFILGPKGNYSCDLTEMSLTITETTGEKRVWDLGKDVSKDIVGSNPHADRVGNKSTWHFYKGELKSINRDNESFVSVPAGSLLSQWQFEKDAAKKSQLAVAVQKLATGEPPADANSPDGVLYRQLMGLTFSSRSIEALLDGAEADPRFGKHPLGHDMGAVDLIVRAPDLVEFKVPAKLAAGRTLVVGALLDGKDGRDGAVRVEAGVKRIEPAAIAATSPIVVHDGSQARELVLRSFNEFRDVFPAHLCYNRIVPVDEVVTLTLFYRQDEALKRLMLTDAEVEELNRLWDELLYVAQEPLRFEVAFEQIREFATQDRPDLVKKWDPLKPGVVARADAFRKRLIDTEKAHLDDVIDLVWYAWRKTLCGGDIEGILTFYKGLRDSGIDHDPAIRLSLARVLTSPEFLYRREEQPEGTEPQPVSSAELATRLSYFLWSSGLDDELRWLIEDGPHELQQDAKLKKQTARMLRDPKIRRLAVQFATQWLHLRDFDQNDDKNEALYPDFAELRDDMYEETVLFFEDMFRNDGSILDLLDADHTFLNETLAKHYGIEGVTGPEWRRVESVKSQGRGGVLGMATLLASQSGASRTSPILRGNWIFETLLGERLPRPPANVPQLPQEVPTGLTARQLIEKHSSVPACAKCHARIDPYGFALEQYDAIGRMRSGDVNTKAALGDGRTVEGIDGLRKYLLTERRDDFVRQFCRKLLGFALGREVQLSDELLLDEMKRKLEAGDYRFSIAVQTIVSSRQFREIRGRDAVNSD